MVTLRGSYEFRSYECFLAALAHVILTFVVFSETKKLPNHGMGSICRYADTGLYFVSVSRVHVVAIVVLLTQ